MTEPQVRLMLERAKEEAILAINAAHPSAAAAHHELSVLYSAKAVLELAEAGAPEDRPDTLS